MSSRGWMGFVGLSGLLFLSLVGCAVPPSPAAPTATVTERAPEGSSGVVLSLAGVPSEAVVGDVFEMEILVEGVEDLYGAEIHLRFDPALFEVVDERGEAAEKVEDGTLLTVRFTAQNQVDPTAGRVDYAVAQMPPTQGANGDGTLVRLRFRAIEAGSGSIELGEALLASSRGEAIAWAGDVLSAEVEIR